MSTDATPQSVTCPHCHKKLRCKKVPAEGKKVQCPNCGGACIYSSSGLTSDVPSSSDVDPWVPDDWQRADLGLDLTQGFGSPALGCSSAGVTAPEPRVSSRARVACITAVVSAAVAGLLGALLPGRGDRLAPAPAEPAPVAAPVAPTSSRNPKIPVEVSYPIIRDQEEAFAKKRMVDVRLNMKVSPEVLREIALDVKGQERRQYARTLIWVYLPKPFPDVADTPWATCHFDPTLEVKIQGLTIEDEAHLRERRHEVAGKVVGAWIIEYSLASHLAVIFEDAGQLKVAEISGVDGRFDSEMVELPADSGRRFKKVHGSEIYAVDERGALRMINDMGRIFSGAMPLK
jgi:hypothetical protein